MRVARWLVEQRQSRQPARVEPEQERSNEQEQQHRISMCAVVPLICIARSDISAHHGVRGTTRQVNQTPCRPGLVLGTAVKRPKITWRPRPVVALAKPVEDAILFYEAGR